MRAKPKTVVGIAGASGAGKSTVVRLLVEKLSHATRVRMDNYFKDRHEFPVFGGHQAWDHPNSIDWKRFHADIFALSEGSRVATTELNKKDFTRKPLELVPAEMVVVEGFLLFYKKSVRDLFNLRVFLDLPKDMIAERRRKRFGRGEHEFGYDTQVVVPAYEQYGKDAKNYADVIIDATLPIDKVVTHILKETGQYSDGAAGL